MNYKSLGSAGHLTSTAAVATPRTADPGDAASQGCTSTTTHGPRASCLTAPRDPVSRPSSPALPVPLLSDLQASRPPPAQGVGCQAGDGTSLLSLPSQTAVCGPAALPSPGSLWEMQTPDSPTTARWVRAGTQRDSRASVWHLCASESLGRSSPQPVDPSWRFSMTPGICVASVRARESLGRSSPRPRCQNRWERH